MSPNFVTWLFGSLVRRRYPWLIAGIVLVALSLTAGIVLLALSGWFITASALAGLGLLLGLDIFTPGSGIRLAAVVRTGARYTERLVTHEATFRILTDIRSNLFSALTKLPTQNQRALTRGDLLGRFTQDVQKLDHWYIGTLGPTFSAFVLTLFAYWVLATWATPSMATPTMLGMLIGQVALALALSQASNNQSQLGVVQLANLKQAVTNDVEDVENILALDLVERQQAALTQKAKALTESQQKVAYADSWGLGLSMLINASALLLMLVLGIGTYQQGQIDGPWLGLVALLVLGLGETWTVIPAAWRRMSETKQAWSRITPYLYTANEAPVSMAQAPKGLAWSTQAMGFSYPNTSMTILDNLNLDIAIGEKVLVIGSSGSGKTTLAYLLMGELTPTKGQIHGPYGPQIKKNSHSNQSSIGYLPQDAKLFADTLRYNLKMACPAASDEKLEAALIDAGLGEWFSSLPSGLDAWIDENASTISGGEARRIALARLMLQDPDCVILDEPNTGLDPKTNQILNESLNRWLASKTAIIITHQPALAPRHDRTIKLDD